MAATPLLVWAALLRAPASARAPASDDAGDSPSPIRRLLQQATRARAATPDDRVEGDSEDFADATAPPEEDDEGEDDAWPFATDAPML